MLFGIHLVRRGLISPMQFVEAVEISQRNRPPLGKLALELSLLNIRQIFKILSAQCQSPHQFGRIAVELGFLREVDVAYLLMVQTDRAKPIRQILLEQGALDAETLADELAIHYREQSERHNQALAAT